MTWLTLLDIISEEVGQEAAAKIEERARREMGGERITIKKRRQITLELINETAPGKPKEAARKLGVSHSTVYRALRRPIIR